MTAPLTGPTWYWAAGTIALVLCAWVVVSTVLGGVAGALLGLGGRQRKNQATTMPPAGHEAPSGPPAQPEPTPLTQLELEVLAGIEAALATLAADAHRNGRRGADGLRLLCPEVPDITLGRIALDTLRWLTTALVSTGHNHHLTVKIIADAYGVAADDLTRADRQPLEVPRAET